VICDHVVANRQDSRKEWTVVFWMLQLFLPDL